MPRNQFRIRHGQPSIHPINGHYVPPGPIQVFPAHAQDPGGPSPQRKNTSRGDVEYPALEGPRPRHMKEHRASAPFDRALQSSDGRYYLQKNGTIYRANVKQDEKLKGDDRG